MFRYYCSLVVAVLLAFAAGEAQAKTMTFQGKAAAAVRRAATVPFTIRVEEVLVSVSDAVVKDTPLLRYSLLPQDARHYQNMLADAYGNVLDLREKLTSVTQEARNASGSVKRDRELAKEGLAPQAELQRSMSALNTAGMRKETLQNKLASSRRSYGLILEELNSYFGSSLKQGDSLPDRLFLTAPIDGSVIDLAPVIRPGGFVNPNVPAVTVAVLNPIQAEIHVHESEIGRMQKDMKVEIEVPDLGGRKYGGRVTSISWASTDMTVGMPSFYVVQIDIDNADLAIRPGYKVMLHLNTD